MPSNNHRHVFLLTTDFKPLSGGIAEYLAGLYANLARYLPVSVVTTVAGARTDRDECLGPSDLRTSGHALHVRRVSRADRRLGARWADGTVLMRKLHTGAYFLSLRRMAERTVREIEREADGCTPEIAIGLWDDVSRFWCRALRRAGLEYSLHVYGKELVEPRYPRVARWRAEDIALARTINSISLSTARLARERFRAPASCHIVPPGVSLPVDRSSLAQRVTELRRDLVPADRCVLLTLGRLVVRKGVDLVLRAVSALPPGTRPLRYLVAGDGPERPALERLARDLGLQDHVRFLGPVDTLTKWALLDLCDVFVSGNHDVDGRDFEGFGITFLEASLSGKPSIAGATGGVAEAIEHGVTGLLVPPGNVAALGSALGDLLGSDDVRRLMGERARTRAVRDFDWDVRAREYAAGRGWLGDCHAWISSGRSVVAPAKSPSGLHAATTDSAGTGH